MKQQDRVASDELQKILVPPPSAASDVCPGCSSWRQPEHPLCHNCYAARNELKSVCQAVIPISLYARPSAFRDIISQYKDRQSGVDEKLDILPSDTSREHCARQIQLILGRFLLEIIPLLEAQEQRWDYITVVPSGWRTGDHPLVAILRAIDVGVIWQPLIRVPDEPLSHNHPNERGFKVVEPVEGRSILLIDDVFTTGASIHSAASALNTAGANVVAGIVIARRIQPKFNEHSSAVWARQSAQEFRWNIGAERGTAIALTIDKP